MGGGIDQAGGAAQQPPPVAILRASSVHDPNLHAPEGDGDEGEQNGESSAMTSLPATLLSGVGESRLSS